MDVRVDLQAPCTPERLFDEVQDLSRYPSWLGMVPRAVPEAGRERAWIVDLRGRLGPMSRSKRLRMVRTLHDSPNRCRFERAENDGRDHSDWVLDATVHPTGDGSATLTMSLHYGGTFGGKLLERMLREEIERSRPALLALVAPEAC